MNRRADPADIRDHAGLCGDCVRAIIRPTRRGTGYLRCLLARSDGRFAKYPRLPVLSCPGHEASESPSEAQ